MMNARVAGVAFLAYIAAGITSMVLFGRATGGEGIAVKLAGIARDEASVRVVVLLGLVQCFCALVLAVTLYAITRDHGPDLALLGLTCRVAEGIFGGLSVPGMLALLWLATATGAGRPDTASAQTLAAYLLRPDMPFTATFFAVGSTFFAWLMLRGRLIPAPLAWLGVGASLLLVAALPLQLAGYLGGPVTMLIWLPMFVFEVPLAFWLIVKGVRG